MYLLLIHIIRLKCAPVSSLDVRLLRGVLSTGHGDDDEVRQMR